MTRATLGFVYTPDFQHVLLIEKQRPAAHKGKLNGLGGKCETTEGGLECMSRELTEEAGINIPAAAWRAIGSLSWQEWQVEIFVATFHGPTTAAQSLTDDPITWYPVDQLPANIVSNLSWLIPLGIDYLTNDYPPQVVISYPDTPEKKAT